MREIPLICTTAIGDTAHSRNPEDKESLSLRGGRTTGCGDSLSAGVRETRQEEERLGG